MSKLENISVLAELDRYQVAYEWAGEDEVKIKCPFHDDQRPSCDVSVSKRLFRCHAANCPQRKGDVITLLAGIVQRPRAVVLEDLASRYDISDVKIVEPEAVERWHRQIWQAGVLLTELRKRAVTDEDIVQYKLGEDNGRITIPIANERGDVVNVRRYLPGAPGDEKMKNQRGRGSARLFPIDQLRFPAAMLCGGEMKAIVAARQLNPHGVGALCATQGEDLLPPALIRKLAGKVAYVCMDVDAAGQAAADQNCIALRPLVTELYNIVLPLDVEKHPKGDINDYVAEGGDLWTLLESAEPWKQPARIVLRDTEPEKVHLSEAANAKLAAKRVSVTGIVQTMDSAPYFVPKKVTVACDKSQNFCTVCSRWNSSDGKFDVHPEHAAILAMVATSKRHLPEALMEAVGIPRACRVCEFSTDEYYNAEDARLSPQLEITERATDQRMQPAICIGDGLELNESYELVGRMYPHPLTQQGTLLVSKYEPTQDALSNYQPRDLDRLKQFQPESWTLESLDARLRDVYDDFERHVTRIRRRVDMHVVVDLAYHSPLLLTIDNRIVKGWVEALIVGDSAQGKTETVSHMMRHYGLGGRIECKNMTTAGLLGGVQQVGNGRWFVTWGFLPKHDKGLAVLEELKGTSVEVISKLTDARSSGIAELTKIERRRTHCRTRIVAVTNARGDRPIESYSFGVDAIKELIGALEDIRRFDVCHIVSKDEVDPDEINQLNASLNGAEAKYSAPDCRALVLWAWTRSAGQVMFDSEVTKLCMQRATELCDEFTDAVPIIDGGSMRYKLARLAASLACRTFSCDDEMTSVVVRPCHVEWVVQFLRRTYSTRAFGYKEFSEASKSIGKLVDSDKIKSAIASAPFPHDLVEQFLRADKIDLQDIQDWCSWDRPEAMVFLALLVRKHALRRDFKCYRKTGPFISLLRSIGESRDLPERPDFIPETEF
jgi:hypothetical protein